MFKKLFLLACAFLAIGNAFETPLAVSDGTTSAGMQQIAFGDSQNAICVWRENSLQNIMAARTTNAGVSWDTPIILTSTDFNYSPLIAFNDAFNAICVWYTNAAPNTKTVKVCRTSNGGASWETPVDLFSVASAGAEVKIAFDSSTGAAICVWGLAGKIQASRSTDFGASWSSVFDISATGTAYSPSITFDNDGNGICVWVEGSSNTIQASISSNSGALWDTPRDIGPTGALLPDFAPQIIFTSLGQAICTFYKDDGVNQTVSAVTTSTYGASWDTPKDISPVGFMKSYSMRIATNNNGSAICVWYFVDGSPVIQATSTADDGATWTTPATISGPSSGDFGPTVIFDDNSSNAICVWNKSTVGQTLTTIEGSRTTDGGLSWQTPFDISSPVAFFDSITPEIANNGSNGEICIWWQPNTFDTIYASANFSTPTVTGVSPNFGPIAGGNSISITGTNFSGATDVSFGANPATYIVNSDISITAFSPTVVAPGTVHVTVTTPGGTSATSPADEFTYNAASSIFSVTGKQLILSSLFENDMINQISWNSMTTAAFYRVYDGNNVLLFQGTDLSYYEHNRKLYRSYSYFVSWVDGLGNESARLSITLP